MLSYPNSKNFWFKVHLEVHFDKNQKATEKDSLFGFK